MTPSPLDTNLPDTSPLDTSPPDIRRHVARRVRITRMFFRQSLEEASAYLDVPVWLLDYKENGLVHFSYQDFLNLERLYKMPWLTFFQDFLEDEHTQDQSTAAAGSLAALGESPEKLDAIMQYLTLGAAEPSALASQTGSFLRAGGATRETHSGMGRWA